MNKIQNIESTLEEPMLMSNITSLNTGLFISIVYFHFVWLKVLYLYICLYIYGQKFYVYLYAACFRKKIRQLVAVY